MSLYNETVISYTSENKLKQIEIYTDMVFLFSVFRFPGNGPDCRSTNLTKYAVAIWKENFKMEALASSIRFSLFSYIITSSLINSAFSEKGLRRGVWNGQEARVLAYNVSD